MIDHMPILIFIGFVIFVFSMAIKEDERMRKERLKLYEICVKYNKPDCEKFLKEDK